MVEQVALGRVVIPALNTPTKKVGDTLVPTPRWRYKGPACTISLSYVVGWWGVVFNEMTPKVFETLSQPASDVWKEFQPDRVLKGVVLTGLTPTEDEYYDLEMWFKSATFADQGAIFTDCCKVPAVAAALEIVSCSFS